MHPRAGRPGLDRVAAAAPLLLSLLLLTGPLHGCASGGSAEPAAAAEETAAAAPDEAAPPVPAGPGIKAGWRSLRGASKTGQITALTLLSEDSREGKLIASGHGRMDGGKVVDGRTAAALVESFDRQGFGRYAVKVDPEKGPQGALGVVWLDRGDGIESLFLVPGQRQHSETRDIPDVYDALKKLILVVHQQTPGSMVRTGQGWSGEDLLKQKPGEIVK